MSMGLVVLYLVGVGTLIGLLAVLRIRSIRDDDRRKALRAKGWTLRDEPDLDITAGLNCPPFGIGVGRAVDHQILGATRSGVEFNVFEYEWARWSGRVAALRLPHALPEAYLVVGAGSRHPFLPRQCDDPTIHAGTAEYAARIAAAVAGPLDRYASLACGADLSIDGNHLVAVGVPTRAAELDRHLEALGTIADALDGLADLARPDPEPRVGVHGTDWTYTARDDSWLDRTRHTRSGHEHSARDVITGCHRGLSFVCYRHSWKSNDNVSTSRTEQILEVFCGVRFRELSVNLQGDGELVGFESLAFNEKFQIRSPHRRFAHAVIHPRQMEFLIGHPAPPFSIDRDGRMRFGAGFHSGHPGSIAHCLGFAHGFLARVPSFVWTELGVTGHPPAAR